MNRPKSKPTVITKNRFYAMVALTPFLSPYQTTQSAEFSEHIITQHILGVVFALVLAYFVTTIFHIFVVDFINDLAIRRAEAKETDSQPDEKQEPVEPVKTKTLETSTGKIKPTDTQLKDGYYQAWKTLGTHAKVSDVEDYMRNTLNYEYTKTVSVTDDRNGAKELASS